MLAASHLLKWTPIVITVVVFVIAALVVLLYGFRSSLKNHALLSDKAFFFSLSIIYLVALIGMLWLYLGNYFGVKDAMPGFVGGILPLAVPWFGALGAVVISLEGVYRHYWDWDKSYAYWHMSRPLFGAVLGSVAFFIYLLLTKAAGTTPPAADTPVNDLVVYWVVAFVVGYREQTFRELIKAVLDVILKPANVVPVQAPAVRFQVGGAEVTAYAFPDVQVAQQHQVVVTIYNTGNAPLTGPIVLVGSGPGAGAQPFAKANDAVSGNDLAAGKSATVDVVFSPPAAGSFSGTLTVMSGSASLGTLSLSGKGV